MLNIMETMDIEDESHRKLSIQDVANYRKLWMYRLLTETDLGQVHLNVLGNISNGKEKTK